MNNTFKILTTLIFILSFSNCKKELSFKFAGGFKNGTYSQIAESLKTIPDFKPVISNTDGSTDNIFQLSDKKADFSIAQLDVLQNITIGQADIGKNVKVLLPLYGEEVHLITAKSIKDFDSLKNKKISIGDSESGTKLTSLIFLSQFGIDNNNSKLEETSSDKAIEELVAGNLDAMVLVSGLPVKLLADLPKRMEDKIQLLSFPKEDLETVKNTGLIYQKTEIPSGTYVWEPKPIQTILVQSVLVCRGDIETEKVKQFLDGVWKNKDALATQHPKWKNLTKESIEKHLKRNPNLFHPEVSTFLSRI
ncbi:MAG: TAXI family TRAP transporter solute-binding subunit [Leptospiraceae bacterium]|nr:TAXI family TRAP transporter solute-binding subunit [Leptospiraceae bacterium]